MSINRHNYEEFFLLYVDKELNEAQQIAVEEFVKQNPDLSKELDMLKLSILTDDNVPFEAKDLLYKKEAGISMANYEEYFFLTIDNELSREEIEEVKRFVLNHPQLQDEFTLLKQTILQAETIQCPQKQALYRTEKKRRVVPFTLMKVSMAAAVTGLIATLWIFTQKNTEPINKNNLATNRQQVNNYTKPSTVAQSSKALIDRPITFTSEGDRNKKIVAQAKKSSSSKMNVKNNIAVANTTTALKQNPKEALPEKDLAVVQTQKQTEEKSPANVIETRKNVTGSSISKSVNEKAANTTFASNQNVETQKPFAKEALYNEITNNDEDRSVYIGATEINKNKLKGFFRRAAIIFDKKGSKSETERTVQIASFEIKSK